MNAVKKNPLVEVLTLRCMANLETQSEELSSLLIAIEFGNVEVLYSDEDQLLGYVAWLSVTKDTLNMMAHTPYLPRYPHEFNEGKLTVVFDVVTNPSFAKEAKIKVVRYLKNRKFFAVLKRNTMRAWCRVKGKYVKKQFDHDKPRFPTPKLRHPLILANEVVIEKIISPGNISIVVPVKNNQKGIDRFLQTIVTNMTTHCYPKEVIIVDNNSDQKVSVTKAYPFTVIVLSCTRLGPGAARNVGAAAATGSWILFTDSDCVATPTLVSGYAKSDNECVAYAGMINVKGDDELNSYYREQDVLLPQKIYAAKGVFPWTIVTANCLVLKSAFDAVNGFNEAFIYAGGEDTDLGFRLRMVGKVFFNFDSVATHEFNDGFSGFVSRFIRYGRGGYILDQYYSELNLHKIKISVARRSKINIFLADAQQKAWHLGYKAEAYKDSI